jgi:3-hydroxybutyryl-CoA dehydrogenase
LTNEVKHKVLVLGAGAMGAGIAQLAAQAEHEVVMFDMRVEALERAKRDMRKDLDLAISKGRLKPADGERIMSRVESATQLDAASDCDLAVEAVVEDLSIKQDLLRRVEKCLAADAIIASNTSSISVTAIAQALEHPQRFVGWHFFNPATRMKLVEIVPGLQTAPEVVQAIRKLSQAWGKTAVVAPNIPGFIVNRVARPFYAEAWRLLAERVATPQTIDALLRQSGGFALGPFELMDLIGHDVNLAVTRSVFEATGYDARYLPSIAQQELVHAGRLGRKTGRGVYAWQGSESAHGEVAIVAPSGRPPVVRHAPDMGLLAPLIERLSAAGVPLEIDAAVPSETFFADRLAVALSDGRPAIQRLKQDAVAAPQLALLDLCFDFAKTPLLGVTVTGDGAPLAALAAVFAAAGIKLAPLRDVAGLVVLRTVCGLVNEAADLCHWTETQPSDVDLAMRLGTAYPQGPLAWGQRIGVARVLTVLANLQSHYGEARYRQSPRLSQVCWSGGTLDG